MRCPGKIGAQGPGNLEASPGTANWRGGVAWRKGKETRRRSDTGLKGVYLPIIQRRKLVVSAAQPSNQNHRAYVFTVRPGSQNLLNRRVGCLPLREAN